jgi:hypothetical protein
MRAHVAPPALTSARIRERPRTRAMHPALPGGALSRYGAANGDRPAGSMSRRILWLFPLVGGLAACQGAPMPDVTRLLEPEVLRTHVDGPPGAEPGTCWGRDETPAVIESVIDHVMIQPPEIDSNGYVRTPAIYRTEQVQRIVREREEIWFRAPCDSELTAETIRSLQRALAARGLYNGPITGHMNAPTRRAVRLYQRDQGLDSGLLSLRAGQQLGLFAYAPEDLDTP